MANVLIIGSGGREHALGWSMASSLDVQNVFYAPGNAGTAMEKKGHNIPLNVKSPSDFAAIENLIHQEKIDLTVVGPEAPLTIGLVDYLNERGIGRVFGPTRFASRLESDKFFSYQIMQELGIPQAESVYCSDTNAGIAAIISRTPPEGIVLKARGLAAGKGVAVCDNVGEALREHKNLVETYGPEILICNRLFGEEFSVFGISDGEKVIPLEIAIQDHKRLLNNDQGPNTGGMGAYGPAPIAPPQVIQSVADTVMTPVIQRMKERGTPFKGFLYAGMMMTKEGPKALEFNVRFGDPECQPAMMMLRKGLYQPLALALEGKLKPSDLKYHDGAACCVVMASSGYPAEYQTGKIITGISRAEELQDVKVFHAGTKRVNGDLVTSGGRVLTVTAYDPENISGAQQRAYQAVQRINFEGATYRTDIANRAIIKR